MPDAAPPLSRSEGPLEPLLLARSINLLAGSSGVGKTPLLALLARQFLHRQPVLGVAPPLEKPPYLAYIGIDKSWSHSVSRWFQLEGVPRVKHYCIPDDRTFQKRRLRTKNDRTAIFHEFLCKVAPNGRSFPPGALVFVDPVAMFLGGNLLDYDAVAVACLEIRQLLQEMGDVALLGTVHGGKIKADKKQRYARLQDHILGSAALHGYTDTQMYLASPEELNATHGLLLVTPRHAPQTLFHVRQDGEGRFLCEEPGSPAVASAQWVHAVLAQADDRTLSLAALIREAVSRECSRRSLIRILEYEIGAGRVRRVAHGRYQAILSQ